jgi:hypothetical protein
LHVIAAGRLGFLTLMCSCCARSITYDVGSKDESFEWMNVHRAPPSLVRREATALEPHRRRLTLP